MSPKESDNASKVKTNKYPWYSPRFWEGMCITTWFGLLFRNRCMVHPTRWPLAFMTCLLTIFNSGSRLAQEMFVRGKMRDAKIPHTPLFIIGHWRSGTTFLHELMVLDPRHTFPTTYECLAPNHFLLTGGIFTRFLKFLMPSRRPMDNMAAGFERPQEDEFALMNLGEPSPYLALAFPNREPEGSDYLDFEGVSNEARSRWKDKLLWFLKRVNYKDPRRLVLKSPTHLGRIEILLELFPDAKFIHIARDPRSVFPSTVRLWKSLYETQAMQLANHRGLEEYVYSCFERMYGAFLKQRSLVADENFCDVRYEDLARDPLGEVKRIYDHLDLGEFEGALPFLEEHVAGLREYKTNTHKLDEATEAEISRRWSDYLAAYPYDLKPVGESDETDRDAPVEAGR